MDQEDYRLRKKLFKIEKKLKRKESQFKNRSIIYKIFLYHEIKELTRVRDFILDHLEQRIEKDQKLYREEVENPINDE